MALVRQYENRSAAKTFESGKHAMRATAFALLAWLTSAGSASALILTGGPVYTLPGGGSCTVSGFTCNGTGATVSCTALNLGAHTHVYFGIKNDTNVNGNTMTAVNPAAGSPEVFRYASQTSNSITYTSTTSVNGVLHPTHTVTNQLVLTLTGSATILPTGGTPGSNSFGDIERVFQIDSGSSFSVDVDVKAQDAFFSLGQACTGVYDPNHPVLGNGGDRNKVDLAFYYSDCGDGVVDSPEQCDEGGDNGSPTSCCNSDCTFRDSSQVCRIGAGPPCDQNEMCSGLSGTCPADDAPINVGTVCRAGSGDSCDQNETCTGVPGQGCPVDDAPSNAGNVCRVGSAGDFCDQDEVCTGVPGATCPPDDAPGKLNQICRPGSGDICDPDERCTGNPGQGCPPDVVANPSTVCRTGSGDMCDPSEHCTAIPGQACPADVVQPSSTVCRAAANGCDVAEHCTGAPGQACPANAFEPAATACNEDNDVCTVDACDGSGNCVFGSNLNCDDGNTCTQDSCDPIDGCQISGTPSNSCVTGAKAVFRYKNSDTDAADGARFIWKGGPVTIGDLGDPTQSTRYELCVYDNRGIQLAMGVNPGAGWETIGSISSPKGYKFKDISTQQDGVKLIKLKGSSLDKAGLKFLAKGAFMPDLPNTVQQSLPFQFPITAQLYASDGSCWEAQFDSSTTRKNADNGFTGKTP